jgi:hypothetical protein
MSAHVTTSAETVIISNGGTPLLVQPRRHGRGVILSQGRSYMVIGTDEIPHLIQAIKQVSGTTGVT